MVIVSWVRFGDAWCSDNFMVPLGVTHLSANLRGALPLPAQSFFSFEGK